MNSLYNIEIDFLKTLNELEENGGELTPELEEKLAITQENFEQKADGYCRAIAMYDSYVEASKCEKKRLNELQKVRENIVDKLKQRLTNAVTLFGKDGKSGNKTYELSTRKLYTRNSESLNMDDNRLELLQLCMPFAFREFKDTFPLKGDYLKAINRVKDSFGEKIPPFTEDDLDSLTFTVQREYSINDLLGDYRLMQSLRAEDSYKSDYKFIGDAVTADYKNGIKSGKKLTIGTLVNKTSLIIK